MPKQNAKKASAAKKQAIATTESAKSIKRKFAPPIYRSFHLSKRLSHPAPKISKSYDLFKASVKSIWKNKKLFIGITIIYILLSLVFVKGFTATTDSTTVNDLLSTIFQGVLGQIVGGMTVLGTFVVSSGVTPTELAGAYQAILLIVVSLAVIWSLRQVNAGRTVRIRDSFYDGMYPLIPFLLVLVVIGIQLLPLILANILYGFVFGGGLATSAPEVIVWGALLSLLVIWTLYMVVSSIFGLYIVALPNMTPMKALRSARALVRYRRMVILRKILFLIFVLFIVLAIIMLPIILFVAVAAEWVFFSLSLASLAIFHSYMYTLYRELLK